MGFSPEVGSAFVLLLTVNLSLAHSTLGSEWCSFEITLYHNEKVPFALLALSALVLQHCCQ